MCVDGQQIMFFSTMVNVTNSTFPWFGFSLRAHSSFYYKPRRLLQRPASGCSEDLTAKLQWILKAAINVLTRTRKYDPGLTYWLPNKFVRNSHLVSNKFFTPCHLALNTFFSFSLLPPNKVWPSTFPPTVWFYFMKKVLILCKSAVYLFCRELNALQDGENSI